MESLAYLHSALAYEASENTDPLPSLNVRKFFEQLNRHEFSSMVGFWFLWLATILAVLNIFNNAVAQSFGEQSERVRELQQRLSELDYITPNNITGYFGPVTRDALREFKRDRNIPLTTDDVDRQTAEALGLIRSVPSQSTNVTTIGATLRRGNTGVAVSDLQRRLSRLGYYFGSIDGDFGVATQNAVIQFQENNGLSADGIAGPATWGVLLSGRALQALGAVPSQIDRLPPPVFVRPASTTVSPFDIPERLQPGDTGAQVFDLQSRLIDCGFDPGVQDGIYGSRTRAAVRQYQELYGIFPTDGIARQNLIRALRAGECVPTPRTRIFASSIPGSPYVVVVPDRGNNNNTLNQVLALKSDAFRARNKRGRYIHAGAYNNRARAESQSYLLRASGLDARVVYFNR